MILPTRPAHNIPHWQYELTDSCQRVILIHAVLESGKTQWMAAVVDGLTNRPTFTAIADSPETAVSFASIATDTELSLEGVNLP